MKKVGIEKVVLLVMAVVLLINVGWLSIRELKYRKYIRDLPRFGGPASYGMLAEDGYNYGVKKPDYLSLTGNLSVSSMEKNEALIIWPKLLGGYEYGVILKRGNENYQIYVDENGEAVDRKDILIVKITEDQREKIKNLLYKADKMWNLK